jgi:hypothetical protein
VSGDGIGKVCAWDIGGKKKDRHASVRATIRAKIFMGLSLLVMRVVV